ncbi:MAG: hypothetical protein EZS28_004753 [Streblomastix strix]|uniref:Uncharacterized protein n=1 Tax=Streblomastix strix TaxID=222440 RepID=A0A5J4WXZ5_9EUKA|nr:MAG: hypothetical protein EZS28_004753 [Streblomastix strix]
MTVDPRAVKYDWLKISWSMEITPLHPLIPLIQRSLNKLDNRGRIAVFIYPRSLLRVVGCWEKNEKKKRKDISQGQLQISGLEGKNVKNSSKQSQKKDDQMKQVLREQQIHGTLSGKDIAIYINNSKHFGIKLEDNYLKLNLRKTQTLVIEQLSEEQFLGCIFTSIMAFCTFSMVEILRTNVRENQNGCWIINSEMWKGYEVGVEIIFRSLDNEAICPTFWLQHWLKRIENPQNIKYISYLFKTGKYAIEEQTPKAIHQA